MTVITSPLLETTPMTRAQFQHARHLRRHADWLRRQWYEDYSKKRKRRVKLRDVDAANKAVPPSPREGWTWYDFSLSPYGCSPAKHGVKTCLHSGEYVWKNLYYLEISDLTGVVKDNPVHVRLQHVVNAMGPHSSGAEFVRISGKHFLEMKKVADQTIRDIATKTSFVLPPSNYTIKNVFRGRAWCHGNNGDARATGFDELERFARTGEGRSWWVDAQ